MSGAVRSRAARWTCGPMVAILAACAGWAASDSGTWGLFVSLSFVIAGLVVLRYYLGAITRREVLIWAIVARLSLLWLPPTLSDDGYRYVWDGMLQTEGVNPYLHVPSSEELSRFRSEPIYEHLNSPDYFTVYPPVSQAIFALSGTVYHLGWETSYYVIKGVFALVEIVGLWLLLGMFRARNVLLYAWNPLVVISAAGQPHGEALVVGLLAGVLWMVRRQDGASASVLLALAGLVKLLPFVLFPLLWRRFRWRGIVPGLVVAVCFAAPYFHPEALLNVADSLILYVGMFEFNAGPYYALKGLVDLLTGLDASKVIGPLVGLGFVLTLPRIYRADRDRDLPLRRGMLYVLGLFIVLATTVHPWYLLPLLALASADRPAWHWFWLSICSLGTFLLYTGGPYWTFVILGWSGWVVLLVYQRRDYVLQMIMRHRARRKAGLILDLIRHDGNPGSVLDLGAGEGYVGEELARLTGADVLLADVRSSNRTRLPLVELKGATLPFSGGRFDVCVLYFVLHHAVDPEAVIREALRVTNGQVVIVESVYESEVQRNLLGRLDRFANRLRSSGEMDEAVEHRRFESWLRMFEEVGAEVESATQGGWWLHPQAFFVLTSPLPPQASRECSRRGKARGGSVHGPSRPATSHIRESDETT